MKRTRVLVVEDSRVQRELLVRALEGGGDIDVVGQADEAARAIELAGALRPDLVLLDLHIPGTGLAVIAGVMASTPMPILVLSALVGSAGSSAAVEALAAGAVEALPKPTRWDADAEEQLRRRVRVLRDVAVVRRRSPPGAPAGAAATVVPARAATVVAVAASTGGPAAIAKVLAGLTGLRAPVLVVQHLHPSFVEPFAEWMARVSQLEVSVARHGMQPRPGCVYIAPGEQHLLLTRGRRLALSPSPVSTHVPSADVLFESVADAVGASAVGVLLTGMGEDGARGLVRLREAGAMTIAQDAASAAVDGMPAAARRLGGATMSLPLEQIPLAVLRAVQRGPA